MKRIHYVDGPPSLTAGVAGTFESGVSREIEPEIADRLLARADRLFREGYGPAETNPNPPEEPSPPGEDHQEED